MRTVLTSVFLCVAAAAGAQQAADGVQPEIAGAGSVVTSGAVAKSVAAKQAGRPVEAREWMVAAANPLAVEAGARVLQEGGSAADALVAVQLVLGLVEPQSSGLGGGAFLVWYDAARGELTTLDGREAAPLEATPTLFQNAQGEPLSFYDAVVGGRSVGVPGTPALLAAAHEKWGRLEWPRLFPEAIALAEDGFEVSPRLASMVAGDALRLFRFDATRDYFFPGGQWIEQGALLKNPAYAETLRRFANEGAAPFYTGDIAADIVATVTGAEGNPGVMGPVDLAIYRVKEREAVCAPYRGHDICGMGPPSSGALTVGQILGLLSPFDLAKLGPESAEAWRLIGDASRLAFADRGRYMADSDHVPVPVEGLLDEGYLRDRSDLLRGETALTEVEAGAPDYDHALNLADDDSIEFPSTSHISVVDADGNVASMTTTIENGFGSRLMVRGFLLNNELTDFSFASHADGRPIANSVAPGKRPRSSMAPTIVMKDGAPVLAVGSPGGSQIIGYVAKTIIAHLDWGMNVQEAIDLPHLVNRFGTFEIEAGTTATDLQPALEAMGFEVSSQFMVSGLHAISIGNGLRGGADPRREGIALGE
ncbi:MAG: gamma-glutamyltransferase [Roseovarius sp.]